VYVCDPIDETPAKVTVSLASMHVGITFKTKLVVPDYTPFLFVIVPIIVIV
jgi:hypothetical protein